MATTRGFEFKGLRELNAALKKIGVPDDAIKQAMNEAGAIVQGEAWRIMPVQTGAMTKSLKVNKAKNELKISVGNNTTVPYAYTFHAVKIGKSNPPGYFVFRVPNHTRRGHPVNAYNVRRRIPNFPFLHIAYDRRKQDLLECYVQAIDRLIKAASNG